MRPLSEIAAAILISEDTVVGLASFVLAAKRTSMKETVSSFTKASHVLGWQDVSGACGSRDASGQGRGGSGGVSSSRGSRANSSGGPNFFLHGCV